MAQQTERRMSTDAELDATQRWLAVHPAVLVRCEEGEWVAVADERVIAHGTSTEAVEAARRQGNDHPLLVPIMPYSWKQGSATRRGVPRRRHGPPVASARACAQAIPPAVSAVESQCLEASMGTRVGQRVASLGIVPLCDGRATDAVRRRSTSSWSASSSERKEKQMGSKFASVPAAHLVAVAIFVLILFGMNQ